MRKTDQLKKDAYIGYVRNSIATITNGFTNDLMLQRVLKDLNILHLAELEDKSVLILSELNDYLKERYKDALKDRYNQLSLFN